MTQGKFYSLTMTSMQGTFHSFRAKRPLPHSVDELILAAASGAPLLRLIPSIAADTSAPAVLFTVDASSDMVSTAMSATSDEFDGGT